MREWPLGLWGQFVVSTADGDTYHTWAGTVRKTGETIGHRLFDVDIICLGFWTCPISLSREVNYEDVHLWKEICEVVAKRVAYGSERD